jgi:hypothetical protein
VVESTRKAPTRLERSVNACALVGTLIALTAGVTAAEVRAAEVFISESTLVIREVSPQENVLSVEPEGLGYLVSDSGAPLMPGAGCASRTPRQARCPGLVLNIDVSAGDHDDLVVALGPHVSMTATGGPGDDLLEGGGKPDQLSGGEGVDSLFGRGGEDRLSGAGGDDLVQGGAAADTLLGGLDDDVVEGRTGGDLLLGGPDSDLLRGGVGADTLDGEDGNDVLIGDDGKDAIKTGLGLDDVFSRDKQRDEVDCRPGSRLRGDRADRSSFCGVVPRAVDRPAAWPPPEERFQTRDIRPPTPRVKTKLIQPGDARKIAVKVVSDHSEKRLIRIRTFGRRGQELRDFKKPIRAKNWRSFRRPSPGRRARDVVGTCCG